jgi:2-haloacid dehalogenase
MQHYGAGSRDFSNTNAGERMKGVFFDVFGTLVDWRGGIARESERILKPRGISLDWYAFAQAWRDQYQPSLEQVRSGREPFVKLDQLHRRNVEPVLARFGATALPDAVLSELVLAWHRLDGWPDAAPGLHMLRRSFLIAPVSNGEIALMVDLARHNGFPWDAILGAEIAQDYKPKPRVYLAACEAFNLSPEDCLMAAAHSSDLAAAAQCGLRTAHIARPDEAGPGRGEAQPSVPVDIVAQSVEDLALQLAR